MHLSDRGGSHRLWLDIGEDGGYRLAPFGSHQLLHPAPLHRGCPIAKLSQAPLDALTGLGLDPRELHGRDDLTDLHRGALHPAQLHHDLLDDLSSAGGLRAISPLVRPDAIERAAPSNAAALHRDEPAKSAGAAQARGGRRSAAHDARPVVDPAKPAMSTPRSLGESNREYGRSPGLELSKTTTSRGSWIAHLRVSARRHGAGPRRRGLLVVHAGRQGKGRHPRLCTSN